MTRVVILGSGGHARALAHSLSLSWPHFTENDADVVSADVVYVGVGDVQKRRALYEKFKAQIPDRGVQRMRGVQIDPCCTIGDNVLFNTGAQVDHDCVIGNHCVISPGAVLCGGVKLGEACFIGAGAIIVEGVELEDETFVPAGTLVVEPNDMRRPQRVIPDGISQGAGETLGSKIVPHEAPVS